MEKLFGEYLIPTILLALLIVIVAIMLIFFIIRKRREAALNSDRIKAEKEEKKRIKLEKKAERTAAEKKSFTPSSTPAPLQNKLLAILKKYPLQSIISAVLIIAIPVTMFFVFSGPKEQKFDPRDFEYTSSELARYQRILNEAGSTSWGLLEYLSYSTRYVEDEETGETNLVVDGFLRNGYNRSIKIDSLELTVKTGDKKETIAAAAFEDDYGVIPGRTSIKWRFTFTADYIENFSAELKKTFNILDYKITKVD